MTTLIVILCVYVVGYAIWCWCAGRYSNTSDFWVSVAPGWPIIMFILPYMIGYWIADKAKPKR